ncbi:hypothetical protein PAN31117_00551 [Pandoraea anapnoica]|uniref:Uncharacterized protein n=1 Tax=Pandoraea anapnoica TaxID=2508301 RepID=A0A5E4ZJ19_9BURK|nr:hypothetical protein [Pandoraea anapnoica]VVE61359.1 hypothetical protein PAN31117_00551 [Pandoraea anapnoica]
MPEISATSSPNFPVPKYPSQSLSERRIDRLSGFTRMFDRDVPSDSAIDAFMSHFAHMGLRDMVLGCLSDGEKKRILCLAARCHVGTFGPGRDFLERRRLLHHVDQDAADLFGALPASIKEAMITSALIGDHGQIVFTFPGNGLRIPLGRTLLGTGEGALTMYEVGQLLMYQEGQLESLLEQFSAGLGRVDAEYPDNEACHVWNDLIARCIDGKPIEQFSNDRTMLGVLAFALRELAGRVSARGLHDEFPILRMLTDSAIAYFHADDPKSCAESLIQMGHFHQQRSDFCNAAWANKIAANVRAGAALDLWNVGRYAEAEVFRELAYAAYVTETAFAAATGQARAIAPPEGEGSPPPLMLGKNIPQSEFDALWAARSSQPMRSSVPPSPT